MNILVVGLGSMGNRRIALIRQMFKDYMIIGVDQRSDRRSNAEKKYGIKTYSSISSVSEIIHCAFVCTSPISHASLIKECLQKGWHVFTELNLVSEGYDECISIAKQKQVTLFLSSTFLFREEIRYISSKISNHYKWNYIYHVGQYLPDWHPWEDYQDFFIGEYRTNGCREILAIELPWLIKTFGSVKDLYSVSDRITGLHINYDDNYMVQLNHYNGNKGILVVDVVSPYAVRKLEVYSEDHYFDWEGSPDRLFEFDNNTKKLKRIQLEEKIEHRAGYSSFIVENAYRKEIEAFFDVVTNRGEQIYSYEEDKITLALIDSIGA